MLVTDLRKILLEERKEGRKPAVVVLSQKDFDEILADLSIKMDVFDPIIIHGVQVVVAAQILQVGETTEKNRVVGFIGG